MSIYTDATILVTGGTGSLGRGVVNHLLASHSPASIRIFSRSEEKQYWMNWEMPGQPLRFLLGDIRDRNRLEEAVSGVDYVFHCAALKHVTACQYNAQEATSINVTGTENVLEAAWRAGVKRLLYLSTDKTVQPKSVMGATKRAAEELAKAWRLRHDNPTVVTARLGNVLFSSGSLALVIKACIVKGRPYTLTDPKMRRFFITIKRAARFIVGALAAGGAGDVWVPRMTEWTIGNLAPRIAAAYLRRRAPGNGDYAADNYVVTGAEPWENMRESLWSAEEAGRLVAVAGGYVVAPIPSALPR